VLVFEHYELGCPFLCQPAGVDRHGVVDELGQGGNDLLSQMPHIPLQKCLRDECTGRLYRILLIRKCVASVSRESQVLGILEMRMTREFGSAFLISAGLSFSISAVVGSARYLIHQSSSLADGGRLNCGQIHCGPLREMNSVREGGFWHLRGSVMGARVSCLLINVDVERRCLAHSCGSGGEVLIAVDVPGCADLDQVRGRGGASAVLSPGDPERVLR
jgi:hypothetical protein